MLWQGIVKHTLVQYHRSTLFWFCRIRGKSEKVVVFTVLLCMLENKFISISSNCYVVIILYYLVYIPCTFTVIIW
jgi:hypothetical protein